VRFGERLPNPFAEGTEMTHWFHLPCAAMKRPDVFLETILDETFDIELDDPDSLRELAEAGIEHRRLPRIDGAQRAPSGRATCRACRELIEKDAWRIKLVFYEEGMFNPAGFIHLTCADEYLGTKTIGDRLRQFSDDLTEQEIGEIEGMLG
jgi:hypothetical protein